MPGKYVSVSYFRRLVADLMHFSMKVPSVTVERHLDLARLVAARHSSTPTPTWSAIFTKAYAMIAACPPASRTSYLTFPWGRYYEHSTNIATLNIDRQLANERVVLDASRIRKVAPFRELDEIIRYHQDEPVTNIPSYRAAVRLSRVPWPFRRWMWWAASIASVRSAATTLAHSHSARSAHRGLTSLLPLLTSQLHYGMIDADGRMEMRLSFDHRVLDGSTAAAAFADLEGAARRDSSRVP